MMTRIQKRKFSPLEQKKEKDDTQEVRIFYPFLHRLPFDTLERSGKRMFLHKKLQQERHLFFAF